MTATEATEPATNPPRNRKKLWSWLAAVLAVVVAVTITLVIVISAAVKDEGYGPIGDGGGFGWSGPGVIFDESDSMAWPRLGRGAAYSLSMLDNEGTRPVRITSVEHDDIVRDAQWAPFEGGPDLFGQPKRWRDFPATVSVDQIIQVRTTLVRPGYCHGRLPQGDGGAVYGGEYVFHWQSRRSSHATEHAGHSDDEPLLLC